MGKKWFSLRNIAAVTAAPFTAGLSLAAMNNGDGDPLIGDLTGANSAKRANEQNIQLQKEVNEKSIELANTAHQREVADLKKAGINPVLTAGGSGSATPTLGTAQVQSELPGGYLGQAAQAASIMNTVASAKQLNAQAKTANSTIDVNKASENLNNAQAQLAKDQHEFYEDTGYFPGASNTEGYGANILGNGWNNSKTTAIRNHKKGNHGFQQPTSAKSFWTKVKEGWTNQK